MKSTEDQAVLLIYAFGALPWMGVNTPFVAGFLYTIIYAVLSSRPDCPIRRGILTAVYLAAAFFCPPVLCFSPAVLYTLLMCHSYAAILPILLLFLGQWHSFPDFYPFFLIPGYATAGLLCYKTTVYQALDRRYRQTKDDGTELAILLKEKNLALQENQNYKIYTATLQERNRIAREIHDHVGHMLSRCILLTGALKTINKDAAVGESLNHLEQTLHTAMDNIRSSVHDLHDESINLREILEGLAAAHSSCPVDLDYDMGFDVPADVKYCLIAIVKEALHNISRHSSADQATVTVREHPGLYQLSIEDNGIPPAQPEYTGMGLANMQDRVRCLHGTIQIYTEQGFRIFITLPKENRKDTAI